MKSPNALTDEELKEITRKLKLPFGVKKVLFRPLRKAGNKYEVAAYLDKVTVMERLDIVVGQFNWSYDFIPVVLDDRPEKRSSYNQSNGQMETTIEASREVTRGKGVLTIFGVPKAAIGESSNMSPSKGCDSDTLKRAAAMWGVGAYLWKMKLQIDASYVKYGKINDEGIAYLREEVLRMQPAFEKANVTLTPKQREQEKAVVEASQEEAYVEEETPELPEVDEADIGDMLESEPEPEAKEDPQEKEEDDGEDDRPDAVEDFQKSAKAMGLKVGSKMNPYMNAAIAEYLDDKDAKLGNCKSVVIRRLAKAIRNKKLVWSAPDEQPAE